METPNNEQITAGVLLEGYGTLADDKVRLKLDAIDTIVNASRQCDTLDVKEEIEALVEAVMYDLGLAWDPEDKMYEYFAKDGALSEEIEGVLETFKELDE